jgi:hypothetical protein
MSENNNIFFSLEELDNDNENEKYNDTDLEELLKEINNNNNNNNNTHLMYYLEREFYGDDSFYYNQEYTVKELLKICHYYGIDKDIKAAKCKKTDIIDTIIYFESLPENLKVVETRHKMWAYIKELVNNPKMKNYIIWG